MTAILRVVLLSAFAATAIPSTAAGQDTSTASLVRRIERLERANADLEQRVRELESLVKAQPPQPPRIPGLTASQDLANWRKLRIGMTMDEVRALLGEPGHVDAGPVTNWWWDDARVTFIDSKVEGWSEPRR